MNKKHLSLLVLAVVAAILIAAGAFVFWLAPGEEVSPGQALFDRDCAACHGAEGRGDGAAAFLLNPKPRNFRPGKFRLVTSRNLQPTREDIFRTISNGMPGTAMPAWGHLPEGDRWLLTDHVLQLHFEGYVEQAIKMGQSPRDARAFAKDMTTPDEPIPIPSEPPLNPAGLEEGRQFYLKNCSNCHGQNMEGRIDRTWRTAEGYPTWSRNLKEGVFKGGRDGKDLYLRFHTGLPGTPMPSLDQPGDTVWRIVQYVQSLSDPAAQERSTVRPVQIVAKRVASLPASPDDPAWGSSTAQRIPLMPLWWVNGYIPEVLVAAVHDGNRIAFRLQWSDSTEDVEGVRQQAFPDGAAIQFAAAADPPLFAMGAAGELVNLWHWKALWELDRNQFHDVAQAYPNMVGGPYFGPSKGWDAEPLENSAYVPALLLDNPVARRRSTTVEEANAAGFGSYTAQASDEQNVQGHSTWKEGVWRLVFSRELTSSKGRDVVLHPGDKVSIAFAVWNGSATERNGQKTVSIWNTCTIEQAKH